MTFATDDEGLMQELAAVLGREREVSDQRRRAAYGAFAWRTVDEELLTLMHDSALQATAAVRGEEDSRTLAFAGGGMSLELELEGSTLTGQVLLPGSDREVTMETVDGGSQAVRTDSSGFFVMPDVSGTVRFAVRADGTVHHTEWVVL